MGNHVMFSCTLSVLLFFPFSVSMFTNLDYPRIPFHLVWSHLFGILDDIRLGKGFTFPSSYCTVHLNLCFTTWDLSFLFISKSSNFVFFVACILFELCCSYLFPSHLCLSEEPGGLHTLFGHSFSVLIHQSPS